MARKLKVYGWIGWRNEAKPMANGSHQTREVMATTSMAVVARALGKKRPSQVFNLCETGNDGECAVALAEPGVIFWRALDDDHGDWRKSK